MARELKVKDELMDAILERLNTKSLADMETAIDLAMRMKLNQQEVVKQDKERLGIVDGSSIGVCPSPLYTALEIAEYLRCLYEYTVCPRAKSCWVTRRGFGECHYKKRKK